MYTKSVDAALLARLIKEHRAVWAHTTDALAALRGLAREVQDNIPQDNAAQFLELCGLAQEPTAEAQSDYTEDDYPPPCSSPTGHEFRRTGTAYGGGDERWGGEGRCFCVHCDADGDA